MMPLFFKICVKISIICLPSVSLLVPCLACELSRKSSAMRYHSINASASL